MQAGYVPMTISEDFCDVAACNHYMPTAIHMFDELLAGCTRVLKIPASRAKWVLSELRQRVNPQQVLLGS